MVILDDYSIHLIGCKFYEKITNKTVLSALSYLMGTNKRRPQKILADNGPQFKKTLEKEGKYMKIEFIHASIYYPQCKGKVERVFRAFNEEFFRVCSVFDNSMTIMSEFQAWCNDSRYHMGISDFPNELYNNNFDVTYVP